MSRQRSRGESVKEITFLLGTNISEKVDDGFCIRGTPETNSLSALYLDFRQISSLILSRRKSQKEILLNGISSTGWH